MELHSARAVARIDLDGGRLASLVVDGLELLVTEGTKASRWGSFPMAPWCGRLPDGELRFEGEEHCFELTSPPHANHGRGYLQRWSEAEPGVIRTELGKPWPFGGHLVQRFALDETSLSVTLEVHADQVEMPAMVGWHPWYRKVLSKGEPAELEFEAESVYVVDGRQIPTGALAPPPAPPWDECFVGLEKGPVIRWPGALELRIESDLDHWVVFTKPDHALCVEPQSGPPNEVNTNPQIAAPGDPLTGTMRLVWG